MHGLEEQVEQEEQEEQEDGSPRHATQPGSGASSKPAPGCIAANQRITQEMRRRGETEIGPLSWMRIGRRGAENPLDVAYYDQQKGEEVPLKLKTTLDALHRDGRKPQPKLHFKGQENWSLIREVLGADGVVTRVHLRPLKKAELHTITLQPIEKIYRTLFGTLYCDHHAKYDCGCLIAVTFSVKTCSHSIKAGGTLSDWEYKTTFQHSCPEHLRTQRTITNGIDGTELTLATSVPIQVDELLKVLASARVDMHTVYNALAENSFTMERAAFYRWYEAQVAQNARGGASMAERLAGKQKRAVDMGTTFIIKPFDGNRLGVASVYVQTKEMRRQYCQCGCPQYRRFSCEAWSRCPPGHGEVCVWQVANRCDCGHLRRRNRRQHARIVQGTRPDGETAGTRRWHAFR
jgi:hypothetical protein